jgi:3-oxoacyl-[acyl-carrier protein] reductase
MRLKDRVAIVTGGARGMGRAYCLGLAREGACVVVNYAAHGYAADDVVNAITGAGGRASAYKTDVGVKAEVEAMVDFAVETYGRLDVMVSNAGIVHKAALLDHDEHVIDRVVHTNIKGNIFRPRRRRGR